MTDTTTTNDPAVIEQDIRRTQEDMSRTVDKIGDQLTIKNVVNSLLDKADENNVDARMLLDGAAALGWRARSAVINADGCLRAGTCGMGCRWGAKRGTGRGYAHPRNPRSTTCEIADSTTASRLPPPPHPPLPARTPRVRYTPACRKS